MSKILVDWPTFEHLLVSIADQIYLSNRYVVLRHDVVEALCEPETWFQGPDLDPTLFPPEPVGPPTGGIGPHWAALCWTNRELWGAGRLTHADSAHAGVHVILLDGQHVGWVVRGPSSGGSAPMCPEDQLPRLLALAGDLHLALQRAFADSGRALDMNDLFDSYALVRTAYYFLFPGDAS